MRNKEAKNPADHVILPELISKEPLGPAERRGDDEWFAIAKWVLFGLIESLKAQSKSDGIEELKHELDAAWAKADLKQVLDAM